MTHDEYVISGPLRRVVVVKHYGPGPHPGTGTPQSVHGGGGASVAEEARPARDIWIGVRADAIPVGTREVDIPREMRFTPGGAPIRGTAMSVDDPRIGDRVYHMTTALDAVSQANELSARGVGGLGGDKKDQIVSMTVSRPVGEQLVRDMRMMAAVAREFGATEPIYDWDRETQTHLRLDRATGQPMDTMTWLRPLLNRFGEYAPQYGFSFSVADVAAYYGMREEQVGTMDYNLREWGNQFFQMRDRYTGVRNPLFFSDTEGLARIDPSQVGLVSIPRENLRTGALLTDFDLGTNFLEEVRLYGDVPLDGAEFIRDISPATPTTVERGGPGSGFEGHEGRPGKVGGSLPENDWRLHGFSAEEFTKNPNLPMDQMPELGKDMSIVYSDRGNKAKWVAQVQAALERFRNATGIAPQGITITDHLPWMLWHGEPYEVLANMQGAEAEEIANVLVRGHFATSRGAYLPQGGPVIYIAPAGKKEEGFDSETIGHELGHWLTMTAAPAALDATITPTSHYVYRLIDSYGPSQIQGEYIADLVESLTRTGGDYERWGYRLNHDPLNADDIENRGVLMDVVRRNLVLRTAGDQPGRLVMVLMGDEIVAVPEAELDDLPEAAIINPLYLWWKEHFQPRVELDLDGKAFGWEAEDIAVQGEPEDGIFAVVEEIQRPKGRKETMAEAAGQEPAPVPEGEAPAEAETPGEDAVKSAFETILKAIFRGGPGSGHHGHKGIPGHQGGSLPSGEAAEVSGPSPWRGRLMPDAVADRFFADYNSPSALQSPEVCEIVTRKGEVRFRKVGGEDFVQYSTEELDRYMNGRRAWLLHNHPGGSSLSEEDICIGLVNGLDGVAAVGRKDGQLRVFSMAFDREAINHAVQVSGMSRGNWAGMVMGNALAQTNSELRYIYQPQVDAGTMTPDEAGQRHMADRLRILDDRPDVGGLISTETLEVPE